MNKEEKGKQKVRRGITITPKKKACHERRDGMRCAAKGTRTLNLKVEKKTKTLIFKDTH